MAVERLTDYTRRIWTGLATDAPDPDMQAGDAIYYMDTSTCSIITGIPAPGSIDTEDLPDIGGGGGDVVMGTTISTNEKVVIPKVPGKDNFFAYVNGDQTYTTEATGRHLLSYRIRWCFGSRIMEVKANTNWLPTLTAGLQLGGYITETDDMIIQQYPNGNTIGILPAGKEVIYIWF